MAKIVTEFPKVRRGRPEQYPYKEWFNGKKWALLEGEDFTVKPASFKAALYARKNAFKMTIKTTSVVDEKTGLTTIYVQRLTGAVAQKRNAANKGKGRQKAKA